jgi:hypothetical protein
MDETNLVGKTVDLHINGIGIIMKHEAGKVMIQIGKVIVAAHVNDIEPNEEYESETTD